MNNNQNWEQRAKAVRYRPQFLTSKLKKMKTENNTIACHSCKEPIGENDFIAITLDGESICESCEGSAWDYCCTAIATQNGEITKYEWCSEFGFRDMKYYDSLEEIEGLDGFKYVRTDGWRGYWDSVVADGYTTLASGWSTGRYDDVAYKHKFNDLVDNILDGTLECPYQIIFAFGLTSNVFSVSSDVIIRESEVEAFTNWLSAEAGITIEELERSLK
jgi:hypothetical protein